MRKMKKLFKTRRHFIPWYYWSLINFGLTSLSLIALFITSFFTDNLNITIPWMLITLASLVPFFIVQFISWIIQRSLANAAIAVIAAKLNNCSISTEKIDLRVHKNTLYKCEINVWSFKYTKSQLNEIFSPIYKEINHKWSNQYYISFIFNPTDNDEV